jgi:ribA/ribD-fused uncharacterized protein
MLPTTFGIETSSRKRGRAVASYHHCRVSMSQADEPQHRFVSMYDPLDPLATFSRHGFELDGEFWPSVEHYVHAMAFEDPSLRDAVRTLDHPAKAGKLAKRHRRRRRKDWDRIKVTYMIRGIYTKCRTHASVANALLETGDRPILETSQYDYFWGCGRDLRGFNHFGEALVAVRERLRQERSLG